MPKTEYKPVPHDHDVFLKKALSPRPTRVLKTSTSWCASCWLPG